MELVIQFAGYLLLLQLVNAVCTWPKTDVLFALDSTTNVDTTANHRRLVDFVRAQSRHMKWGPDGNQVAVAQFTPHAKYEFGFVSNNLESLDRQLNSVPYVPCQSRGTYCMQDLASLNTLVRGALSADEGNRVTVPDVLVVISTSLYEPREVRAGELLVRPLSPTHVFIITIGNGAPSTYTRNVQFAATTNRLAAIDFNSLIDLELPLCESVNSFLGEEQTRTSGFLKPSLCVLIIALTSVIAVLIVLCLSYTIYRFRNDNRRLGSQLRAEQENLRKQEEYYNEKLRERSAHVKEREKTMLDLINESQRIREYRDQPTMPLPVTVVNNEEEEDLTLDDRTLFNLERSHSHLPADHPARALPPIDLLLLVDASSSIGINSYETVKQTLREFVNDIDIAPGRSRVATIVFANEPQVYFGFDRYYTVRSVRTAIRRMPYLGGPTFLAKALSFSAGVFYQEQNMKEVTHRNRTMPTPRHDRPQIMIVVSDGISDDNFDRQATQLHERMLVKIGALVTKSFNKERLIPVTRFDGAVFTLDQREAMSLWLWRTQRLWNENYAGYVEREKTFNLTGRRTNRN